MHETGPMPVIEVEQLNKTFQVPVREAGLRASLRSLVHRRTTDVVAADAARIARRGSRGEPPLVRATRAR